MEKVFFSGWDQVATTAGATAVVYACALAAVRLAGRRTPAELSAEMLQGISGRSDGGDDPCEDPHPLTA